MSRLRRRAQNTCGADIPAHAHTYPAVRRHITNTASPAQATLVGASGTGSARRSPQKRVPRACDACKALLSML